MNRTDTVGDLACMCEACHQPILIGDKVMALPSRRLEAWLRAKGREARARLLAEEDDQAVSVICWTCAGTYTADKETTQHEQATQPRS